MQCELECGHCGYQFALDAAELPRTTKCAVCGGVLAIVVPRVVPEPAPPPKPKPKPPPPAPPPKPRRPVPPVSDAEEPDDPLARPLAEPWPLVRGWLNAGRVTTDLGRYLYGVFLFLDLFVWPLTRTAEDAIGRSLATLIAALLFPAIFHIGSQVVLVRTPPAHGGELAYAGAKLLGLAVILGVVGAMVAPEVGIAIAVLVTFVSFGFWLAFLGRLGQGLGDDALASAARAYRVWFPLGLVLFAVLLVCAVMAARVPTPPLVWFGRLAAGAVALVLLYLYSALLRLAVRAIDRRAPAAPRR